MMHRFFHFYLVFIVFVSMCAGKENTFPFTEMEVEISNEAPTDQKYITLRELCNMRTRSLSSAEKGIKHALFWITLRYQGQLIGMGRVIGDGGTVVQITDIAVHPYFQKRGYGKFIFDAIQSYILKEIPDDAFVCLFAEKQAAPFYQKFGYVFSHDRYPAMYWPCVERQRIHKEANQAESSAGSAANVP